MAVAAVGMLTVAQLCSAAQLVLQHAGYKQQPHLQRVLHPLAMPACAQVLLWLQPRLLSIWCGTAMHAEGQRRRGRGSAADSQETEIARDVVVSGAQCNWAQQVRQKQCSSRHSNNSIKQDTSKRALG
jgi:hypothetical protein